MDTEVGEGTDHLSAVGTRDGRGLLGWQAVRLVYTAGGGFAFAVLTHDFTRGAG